MVVWGITISILTYKLVQINTNLKISIIYRHLKYIPFLPTSLCYYKSHLYISPLTVLLYCLMKFYFKSDRRKELQTKIHCTAFYIYLGIYLYQCSVFFMWLKITPSVFSIWRIHFMIFMGGVRSTSHEWVLCVYQKRLCFSISFEEEFCHIQNSSLSFSFSILNNFWPLWFWTRSQLFILLSILYLIHHNLLLLSRFSPLSFAFDSFGMVYVGMDL